MKKINALKSLVPILLSIAVFLTSIPLYASDISDEMISDAQHKQAIEQFLTQIETIQSQVADIALSALKDPSPENRQLQSRINLINNNIERLNKIIQDYLATIPVVSDRTRHVLLTFNVLNLVKSSLYTLNLLINTTSDTDRIALLDDYFSSRVAALDTLEILEEILEKFNT
ncbi:MAG: hypothetical protein K0S71_2322 [Clostridia bacterium]|jgi:hypothetical protein|nr:hypothetical protein [Clostridia bacterium]